MGGFLGETTKESARCLPRGNGGIYEGKTHTGFGDENGISRGKIWRDAAQIIFIRPYPRSCWQVISAKNPYFLHNKRVTPFYPRGMRRIWCSKMSVTRHRQRDGFIVAGLERRDEISNPRAERGCAVTTGEMACAAGCGNGDPAAQNPAQAAGALASLRTPSGMPPEGSQKGGIFGPGNGPRGGVIKIHLIRLEPTQ